MSHTFSIPQVCEIALVLLYLARLGRCINPRFEVWVECGVADDSDVLNIVVQVPLYAKTTREFDSRRVGLVEIRAP